jgi:signal transduction histidine kinase
MHPSILDDLGLVSALESLCFDLRQNSKIHAALHTRDVPEEIDPGVASCLYRVAQESLQNVAKHANASQAEVTLSRDGEYLLLEIADAGVGFDPSVCKSGLGTTSMRERIRIVNGTFSIKSKPGEGTRVTARAPLAGARAGLDEIAATV